MPPYREDELLVKSNDNIPDGQIESMIFRGGSVPALENEVPN